MESLPLGNFFEVTINSNKLFALINEMMGTLKDQAKHISALQLQIKRTSSVVQKRGKQREENLEIEIEKVRKLMKEEVNYMRLFMRDVDKKGTDRMGQLQQMIVGIKDMSVKNKAFLEDDMAIKYSYLQKKMTAIEVLDEQIKNCQNKVTCLEGQIEKTNERIDFQKQVLIAEDKKMKGSLDRLAERITQAQISLKHEELISMRNTLEEDQRPRKNHNQLKSQAFLNIINRIEQVENNLNNESIATAQQLNSHQPRRSLISNNKVVKSGTNIAPKSGFATKKENKFAEFQDKVMTKLQKIEHLSTEKIGMFEKEVYRFSNKAEVVDQHIGILSRKIEKEKNRLTEISEMIRTNQDKKIDQKVIQNLKNMIKKTTKDLEEGIENRLSKEVYEKEKSKVFQKLHIMNDLIFEKAEKSEVKKGLTFLQDKLKEIIIVLAEQRGTSQDGAIKKTPYKCLSCDKDLESERQQQASRQKDHSSNLTHYNTSQMRKRIRMVNNTVSTMQFNDD